MTLNTLAAIAFFLLGMAVPFALAWGVFAAPYYGWPPLRPVAVAFVCGLLLGGVGLVAFLVLWAREMGGR